MNSIKILLVEDNCDEEELAMRALRRSGITNEVCVVRDGQEAIDYVFAEGPHAGRKDLNDPYVILLDINLPKLNGLEVLKRIRENEATALIPVVLLTSSDEERDMVEGYKLGANSYINKPYDFSEFANQMKMLGTYWLDINKFPPIKARD